MSEELSANMSEELSDKQKMSASLSMWQTECCPMCLHFKVITSFTGKGLSVAEAQERIGQYTGVRSNKPDWQEPHHYQRLYDLYKGTHKEVLFKILMATTTYPPEETHGE